MMQVNNRKLFLLVALLAAVSMSCLALQMVRRQDLMQNEVAERNKIEVTLIKLQSHDESDVLEAKAELLEMGRVAIEPLIALLKQLTNKTDDRSTPTAGYELKQRSQGLDPHTKSTLENAIYEVLGQMHAVEAVPLLVVIMEDEEIDNMIQGMSPVMRALAEIGEPAVPRLIESIDRASVLIDSSTTEEARSKTLGGKGRIELGRIQLRATLVLRAIGDPRSIPALERLQNTSDNEFIVTQAREAIIKIQRKGQ